MRHLLVCVAVANLWAAPHGRAAPAPTAGAAEEKAIAELVKLGAVVERRAAGGPAVRVRWDRRKVTDEQLVHLKALPRLKHLDLSMNNIRGPGLAHLEGLAELEELLLRGNRLDRADLAPLSNLRRLRALDLYRSDRPRSVSPSSALCPPSVSWTWVTRGRSPRRGSASCNG